MRVPPFNPHIAIAIGIFAMSTTAILVKLIITDIPITIIALAQLLIACIMMTPFVLWKYREEFKLLDKTDWLLLLLASICLIAHFMFWFESLHYTSVISSVLMISIHPIIVFIGSAFILKHYFSAGAIISICIIVLGLFILNWEDAQLSMAYLHGNILSLIGALAFAITVLISHRTRKKLSFMTYLWMIYGAAALLLAIYTVFNPSISVVSPSSKGWIILILLAILPAFFGHVMANYALRWLRASTVSMGAGFQPLIVAILAYSILDETIAPFHMLSGTIVVFGLFLFNLSTSRKQKVTISHKNH